MGVRHLPYALARAGVSQGDLELDLRLEGSAGGSWRRQVKAQDRSGVGQQLAVAVSGPAWAWVVATSRRSPGRAAALAALTVAPAQVGTVLLGEARASA